MKKNACFPLWILIIIGLVSCDLPASFHPDSAQKEIDKQYQEVSVLLTRTAQVENAPAAATIAPLTPSPAMGTSMVPVLTATITPQETGAPSATETQTPAQAGGKAIAAPCDRAQLGFPIDINVPDGTHFLPGETFAKTWRLVNSGSCGWTNDYTVVWFSGDSIGVNQAQPLSAEVRPGAAIDVTVDMVAPQAPGSYQSNWKIQNQKGELFGIGPNGDAPFWVRIVVIPVDTPTPTPPAVEEITATPVIFASGALTLKLGEGVDLDSAQINQAGKNDLIFQGQVDEEIQLAPLAGAHLVSFGANPPQLIDCSLAGNNDAPVPVDQNLVGIYLCYRTRDGLPGWITIKSVDVQKGQVELEFLTWAVP